MRVAREVVDNRRQRLAEMVQGEGFLPLAELCRKLAVSEPTARRDLAALARDKTITRTRGGALCDFQQRFPSFRERQLIAASAKRRIARAVTARIAAGMTIFLDAGSTVHAVAEAIARDRALRPLTVISNSLTAAELLSDCEGLTVHLLGGRYLRRLSMLLGPEAVANLQAWQLDLAIIGAEGLDANGLSNSNGDVVALQRAALARAGAHIACVHAAKIGNCANEPLLTWDRVAHLVTDASPAQLRNAAIRLPPERLTCV
jgi:DeoR/GlpR family transcriptional regulator of sugar metabolism